MLETDKLKLLAMQDRRRELLETLMTDLGQTGNDLQVLGFEGKLLELMIELSEIMQQLFEFKYEELKSNLK